MRMHENGGKQSRERYIFAVNKMDDYNPEDDDISNVLLDVKKYLEEHGILTPNIFPLSAFGRITKSYQSAPS